jgi:hypothetical protein
VSSHHVDRLNNQLLQKVGSAEFWPMCLCSWAGKPAQERHAKGPAVVKTTPQTKLKIDSANESNQEVSSGSFKKRNCK